MFVSASVSFSAHSRAKTDNRRTLLQNTKKVRGYQKRRLFVQFLLFVRPSLVDSIVLLVVNNLSLSLSLALPSPFLSTLFCGSLGTLAVMLFKYAQKGTRTMMWHV